MSSWIGLMVLTSKVRCTPRSARVKWSDLHEDVRCLPILSSLHLCNFESSYWCILSKEIYLSLRNPKDPATEGLKYEGSMNCSPGLYNSDYNLMFCGSNIIFFRPEAANCCYIFIKHNVASNSRKMSQNKKRDHPDSLNRTKYYLNFQLNRQVNLAAAHIIRHDCKLCS